MERQAREQKSMGNLLAIIVYVLIGFFVLSTFLAGYGIFALSKQIKQQSLTIDELDKHYAAENEKLNAQLDATRDTLAQAQAQIGRQQALILQEQEAINKLAVTGEANAAALRQERTARADEDAELRDRLRSLEYHGGATTQRY
jgi:membrane protein required for beta-lactamase induction